MPDALPPFHEYQNRAVDFALDRPGAAIFARPGKGKTRIALDVIHHTGKRTLVLAPKFAALTVWQAEAAKWRYDFDMRVLHGKEKHPGSEDVTVINYDALTWAAENLDIASYGLVVYDELSKMKAPGTSRFRRWRTPSKKVPYRLGLTGTPVGNHLVDLWGEMFVIDSSQTLGTSVDRYRRKFFYPEPYQPNVWHPKDGAQDDILELIKPNALALDFYDGEMPELLHNRMAIQLPKAARELYNEMQADRELKGTNVVAVNAGVRSQKLRQMAAGAVYDDDRRVIQLHTAKADALAMLVDELQGDPALVFFEFHHDYAAICKALRHDVPVIHGATSTTEMVDLVRRWNAGDIPVLAAHPKTAGMGGNMQESGRTVIWYTIPWSLEAIEQGMGRVWRQGQKRSVVCHYLTVQDTKDDDVFDAAHRKEYTQNAVFDALTR